MLGLSRCAGKWRRRLTISVLLAGILIWFVPMLVAHSPLLGWLVRLATADIDGSVAIESASLGWLSPMKLRGVSVRDAAGEPLAFIPTVTSAHSLLGLLCHPSSPGTFQCDKASLEIVFTKDATNLEMALARYLVTKADATPVHPVVLHRQMLSPLLLAIEMSGAKISVRDPATRAAMDARAGDDAFGAQSTGGTTIRLQIEATVTGLTPGSLAADLTLDAHGDGKTELTGHLDNFPISLAAPVIRRFQPKHHLEGRLQGKWDLAWNDSEGRFAGELLLQDCVAHGPMLGADTLRLTQVKMPWKLSYADKCLHVDTLALTSEVGSFNLQGNIDTSGKPRRRFASFGAEARRSTWTSRGWRRNCPPRFACGQTPSC